jgi:hypothetical protein
LLLPPRILAPHNSPPLHEGKARAYFDRMMESAVPVNALPVRAW